MKKCIQKLALFLFVFTILFSGCKKGEEDPFLSFRSRDARVIGNWKLKSWSETNTVKSITTVSNNVNSERYNTVTKNETTINIEGNTKTTSTIISTDQTITTTDFEDQDFVTSTINTNSTNTTTTKYDYSIELEINKDYTFIASYTEKAIKRIVTSRITDADGSVTIDSEETIFDNPSSDTWTENGQWHWLDSQDNKIMVSAGPMMGSILRLAHKEIIIDREEGSTDKSTNQEITNLLTYTNIDDPFYSIEGKLTTIDEESYNEIVHQEWEAK